MSRRRPRPISVRNAADFATLAPRDREKRAEALAVAADMRRNGWSLTRATRENGIGVFDALRFGGGLFRKGSNGRYTAGKYDRQYQPMEVLTTEGIVTVETRDSRTRSLLGRHEGAVGSYLGGRGDARLRTLPRRTFVANGQKHTLATNPRTISEMDRRGEVAYEDLYVQ
jgi:hypothetical protein